MNDVTDKVDKYIDVFMKEHLLSLKKFLEIRKLPSQNQNYINAEELEELEVEVNEVDFTRTIDPHEDDTSSVEDKAPKTAPDSPFECLGK